MTQTKLVSFRFSQRDFERLDELVELLSLGSSGPRYSLSGWNRTEALRQAVKEALDSRKPPTSDNDDGVSYIHKIPPAKRPKTGPAKSAAKRRKKRAS